MQKRFLLAILIIVSSFFVWANTTHAGFGISPPYVRTNKPIFPGSTFEQTITLLRSSAEEEMQAKITINAPEIEDWITIDKGEVFSLPQGELQVPMVVRIDVPSGVDIGNYRGYINVRIVPKGGNRESGVAIALGARVEIDLNVTDQTFLDFIVRNIDIPDFETLAKPWNWKIFSRFFYRIRVAMNIENTGNAKIAPSRVDLDIFDITEKHKLESSTDTSLAKIEPFSTKEVVASFPTKLNPGQYWGKVEIYKENKIIQTNKIAFTIYPAGESPKGPPSLGPWPWIMLGAIFFLGLLIILLLIRIKVWRYLFELIYFIIWPLRYIWRKLAGLINKLKIKFMKWLHRKSAGYTRGEDESDSDETKTRNE